MFWFHLHMYIMRTPPDHIFHFPIRNWPFRTLFVLFSANFFKCENGAKIPMKLRCDGNYDCPYDVEKDYSDEKSCPNCKWKRAKCQRLCIVNVSSFCGQISWNIFHIEFIPIYLVLTVSISSFTSLMVWSLFYNVHRTVFGLPSSSFLNAFFLSFSSPSSFFFLLYVTHYQFLYSWFETTTIFFHNFLFSISPSLLIT